MFSYAYLFCNSWWISSTDPNAGMLGLSPRDESQNWVHIPTSWSPKTVLISSEQRCENAKEYTKYKCGPRKFTSSVHHHALYLNENSSFCIMHTDLSPHLHTDECNKIIDLLRQCRIDSPLTKWIGKCNPEYNEMTKCLKKERLVRRQKNYEISLERKERLNKIFEEQRKMRDGNID